MEILLVFLQSAFEVTLPSLACFSLEVEENPLVIPSDKAEEWIMFLCALK